MTDSKSNDSDAASASNEAWADAISEQADAIQSDALARAAQAESETKTQTAHASTEQIDSDDEASAADDWAAALAEQAAAQTAADDQATMADDWTAALAEQQAASSTGEETLNSAPAQEAARAVFREMGDAPGNPDLLDRKAVMEIPITLSIQLGSTRLSIRELLDLGNGSTIELQELADESMDIFVNEHRVAKGEVVVVDNSYGIRITEISERAERIDKSFR